VPYLGLASVFLYAYTRRSGLDIGTHLRRRWSRGLVGALIFDCVMVWGVVQQPASPSPRGLELVFALLWLGGLYGVLDAMLLTVIPVLAIWQMCAAGGMHNHWCGRLMRAIVALIASLFVTAAYHWGYVEFRGPAILNPIIGNAIITLGYLVTSHLSTPVVAHVAMHVAAVFHGMETTVQLPPHY